MHDIPRIVLAEVGDEQSHMKVTESVGQSRFQLGQQAILYVLVGMMNAMVGYACFWLLYHLLHSRLHYLVILTISNILYMLVAFASNRRLVFKSTGAWLGQSMRYYQVFAVCVGVNYLMMFILVEHGDMKPPIAQIPAAIASMTIGFFGSKFYAFR